MAMRREASTLEPGPDGSQPWSFPRLVQPVLDKHCVGCHSGKKNGDKPDLTGAQTENFTVAYQKLRSYVRWYEWGENTIEPILTRPGRMPSTESPLVAILDAAVEDGKVVATVEVTAPAEAESQVQLVVSSAGDGTRTGPVARGAGSYRTAIDGPEVSGPASVQARAVIDGQTLLSSPKALTP